MKNAAVPIWNRRSFFSHFLIPDAVCHRATVAISAAIAAASVFLTASTVYLHYTRIRMGIMKNL